MDSHIRIATRGSALALAQSELVKSAILSLSLSNYSVELKVITTSGDKLQTASLAASTPGKGLFTKEIEEALLSSDADLAVHSLKDLPTELPDGLVLGAALKREDVRDVLITRASDFPRPLASLRDLKQQAVVATSSTRRAAQILALRPDISIVPIRGNVGTRLRKLANEPDLDATILATAGLNRLGVERDSASHLFGRDVPHGLAALPLEFEEMLPCVGQAAIGLEIRAADCRMHYVCEQLNDSVTWASVVAERAFLRGMGGGCQSPVGAIAVIRGDHLEMRACSFVGGFRSATLTGSLSAPVELGHAMAERLKNS